MQIIHDINCLATEVCGDYLQHVLQLLSSCSSDDLDLVKQSILQGGKSLTDLVPLVISAIVETLVEKSIEVSFSLVLVRPCYDLLEKEFKLYVVMNVGFETAKGDNRNLQDDE